MSEFEEQVAQALQRFCFDVWMAQGDSRETWYRAVAPRVAAAIEAAATHAWNRALVTRGHQSAEVTDQGIHDRALAALRGASAVGDTERHPRED